MATTYVEIDDKYIPQTNDQPIYVSATIGDGQTGDYLLFLDTTSVNNGAPIGTKSQVLNKRTIVTATVVDVLEETNWTSLTVTVKEGNFQKVYGPYSKEAAKHLDTVIYIIKILNTNA